MFILARPILTLLLFWLNGCATKLLPLKTQNYELHVLKEATRGEPMVEFINQDLVRGDTWLGRGVTQDGWNEEIKIYKEELIYRGRIGDSVVISYRESGHSSSEESYHKDITHDLNISKEVSFKYYRLRILSADNSSVKFQVLEDSNI